jgi:Ca2+/H+ antiporter
VVIPSLFVTLAAVGTLGRLQLAWLLVATLFALAALARPGGMRRVDGAALIALYFAFAVGTLVGA